MSVRQNARELFKTLNAQRLAGEFGEIDTYPGEGNVAFRNKMIAQIMEQSGISRISAATAYNFVYTAARNSDETSVRGLDWDFKRRYAACVLLKKDPASLSSEDAYSKLTDAQKAQVDLEIGIKQPA